MGIRSALRPRPTLGEGDIARGLRWMTWEGAASMGFWSITTSGFLAGYALMLGCSNFQIGFLAALPFLMQPLQIAAIPLVERLRWRKAITLATWVPAQLFWLPIALIPIYTDTPGTYAVILLLGLIAVRGIFSAVANCAWNSWIKDLVPQAILGAFFARRQAWASATAMTFGVGAAVFVDLWEAHTSGDDEILGYTYALLFGIVFLGIASPVFMSRIPEPLMQLPPGTPPSLRSMLAVPFKDRNYRRLTFFLFSWGLALNLATPFFAVYMLQELALSLVFVMGMSVLSQLSNIMFLRVWGPLADRFSFKTVLSVSASLYLFVIFGWIFAGMPDRYALTIPLLAALHVLAGIASAGVTIGTGAIGLKLAPRGHATSYLAVVALATSLGAGLGPLIGGGLVRSFGFDVIFGVAFVVGLLTLQLLVSLREEGEVGRELVIETLFASGRQFSRPMSSFPGLNFLGHFPYGYLRRIPFPGLDVAIGVTAFQVAQTARMAALAAGQGESAGRRISQSLQMSLEDIAKAADRALPIHRFEMARHGVRGVLHALNDTAVDIENMTRAAVDGVAGALKFSAADSPEILRGMGHGAVQGAGETGGDLGAAARGAIQAIRELARQKRLNEDAAVHHAAQGAIDAAGAIGPRAQENVRESLADEVQRWTEGEDASAPPPTGSRETG